MNILFKTERLRKQCTNHPLAIRAFGDAQATKLRQRLDDLSAAATLETARLLPGRYHELSGDRHGQLAVSLKEPYRLVFEPADDPTPYKPDGGLDWSRVTVVRILEIVNYHD